MDKIVIDGGKPLHGTVEVSGSKNATLPILCATMLGDGPSRVGNVPELADVGTMVRLLRAMGAQVQWKGREVRVLPPDEKSAKPEAPYELVKTMRASVLVLGPLCARYGRGRVSLPGGCAIGARPIDQHLKGLQRMGADIELVHGYVEAKAKRLRGDKIVFDMPTVTGTENLMMAAALAEGRTVLENAAREPEIVELAGVLRKMGARIAGDGTRVITIDGVERLTPFDHDVIADRIEAGTFLVAGAITGGDVRIAGAVPDHLDALCDKLREAGATIDVEDGGLRVRGPSRPRGVQVSTQPYPGFPTDMQAQIMAMCAVASGQSVIAETVFENRFMHVQELDRMGASIRIDGHTAIVQGVPSLSGAPVMATDLRASACLVLAGLRAQGTTEVLRVYHLDRGYEHIERKLQGLGAQIQRVKA